MEEYGGCSGGESVALCGGAGVGVGAGDGGEEWVFDGVEYLVNALSIDCVVM